MATNKIHQFFLSWSSFFGVVLKKSLPNPRSLRFVPVLFPRSFIVLCFTLRAVIHIESIFMHCVKCASTFIFLHVDFLFSLPCLWGDYPCSIVLSLLEKLQFDIPSWDSSSWCCHCMRCGWFQLQCQKPPSKLWPKQKFLFYVKVNLAVMGWYTDFALWSLRNPISLHFAPWQSSGSGLSVSPSEVLWIPDSWLSRGSEGQTTCPAVYYGFFFL